MNLSEFDRDITTIYDLVNLCNDEGVDSPIENIYSGYSLNSMISDDAYAMLSSGEDWVNVRNFLADQPDVYEDEYYIHDEYHGTYREIDEEEAAQIISDARDWLYSNDILDDDEEEEEEEVEACEEQGEEQAEPVEENEILELFADANKQFTEIISVERW